MKAQVIKMICVLVGAFFILSCSEEDKLVKANPDLLMKAMSSKVELKLESHNASQKEELEKKIREFLSGDQVCFSDGYLYEMKLDAEKSFYVYQSRKDCEKDKVYKAGSYIVVDNEMVVSYLLDGIERSFAIKGSFASVFYNHFIRKNGSGAHHDIIANFGFDLQEDCTNKIIERFKTDYPDVEIQEAWIVTDMATVRPLQTFRNN